MPERRNFTAAWVIIVKHKKIIDFLTKIHNNRTVWFELEEVMEHAPEISWDSDREWGLEDMLKEEVFENILDEVDDSLDQSNVIEEIKNRLEYCEEWKKEYEKWKKNGFDINHYFERDTLLHKAVYSGFHNLVNALVANGADPNIVNLNGHTPLSLAAKEEQKEILSSLLKADNVNVNTTIESGSTTLLHLAVWFLSGEEVLETLLVLGANIDAVDDQGRTTLQISAEISKTSYHGKRFTEHSKVLIKHTVLRLRNPEEIKPFYITNNTELLEHWGNCRDEIREMQREKKKKIGNSNVSLYQFLSEADPNKLAGYLSNANVRRELEEGHYQEKYPLYASMIKSQYDKGMKTRELLIGCEDFLIEKSNANPFLVGVTYELAQWMVRSKVMSPEVKSFMESREPKTTLLKRKNSTEGAKDTIPSKQPHTEEAARSKSDISKTVTKSFGGLSM